MHTSKLITKLMWRDIIWHILTDLFGLVGFQIVYFQQLDVQILERFPEGGVDFVVQLRQFQELGIDWWNELKGVEFF